MVTLSYLSYIACISICCIRGLRHLVSCITLGVDSPGKLKKLFPTLVCSRENYTFVLNGENVPVVIRFEFLKSVSTAAATILLRSFF